MIVLLLAVAAGGVASSPAGADSLRVSVEERDSSVEILIRRASVEAIDRIEGFFGLPFAGGVQVRVFPDRAALTAYWRSSWGVPDLQVECWQVASGTASLLAILSPLRWKEEACEHDPADTAGIALLVAHELVHVFHAQRSPHPEFDGMDTISWLVEGLATYVSGQLERRHAKAARAAIDAGADPRVLARAWSGRYRYGVAGSIVRYIDETYGREVLKSLLTATAQEEVLRALRVEEGELLLRWRAWVLAQEG
jgi:hypothetical protein